MKELEKTLFYLFFSIEIVLFIFFYIFGTHGVQALQHLKQENETLYYENEKIKKEILCLESLCNVDKEYLLFYKEKIARERLQMARPDDIIYYLDI